MITKVRKILTPCPPKKHCAICEARLNAVFGSADKTAKYEHQAGEAGHKTCLAIVTGVPIAVAVALALSGLQASQTSLSAEKDA